MSYHKLKGWHQFLMVLGVMASVQSGLWTYDIAIAIFDRVPTAILLALIFTVLEIVSLYQLIITENMFWVIGVLAGFSASIAGSFGNFQTAYETNVENSRTYQAQIVQIEQVEGQIRAADSTAAYYHSIGWPRNASYQESRADKLRTDLMLMNMNLKNLRADGDGTENALFRTIANHANIAVVDAAERSNLIFGIIVECFMLLCTGISAFQLKKRLPGKVVEGDQPIAKREKKKSRSRAENQNGDKKSKFQEWKEWAFGSKREPVYEFYSRPNPGDGDSPPLSQDPGGMPGGDLNEANSKIQRNKMARMLMLADYLCDFPDASLSEMAEAIGVSSRETARKYCSEISYYGGPEGFRQYYQQWEQQQFTRNGHSKKN